MRSRLYWYVTEHYEAMAVGLLSLVTVLVFFLVYWLTVHMVRCSAALG